MKRLDPLWPVIVAVDDICGLSQGWGCFGELLDLTDRRVCVWYWMQIDMCFYVGIYRWH
ncbi:Uncharacterised protein [Dermatophilus congolensis]|uniref:Uncharacterized protein n=1 Tax=Dermatophilus congolensis TaxID=1863 RepID=A0AA46BQ86_9MICO|nr:Uncharacterised protein [Dermatophilus congolensis]